MGTTVPGVAQASIEASALAEEDALRANVYTLLGRLLKSPPTASDLSRFGSLKGDASELGQAISALAAVARAARPEAVDDEFHDLFIGVGRGELLPYGSYYLAGFPNEKPLANLRIDMAQMGIGRAEGVAETEDHIAALCETMAGLITGTFGEPADLSTQQRFFDTHVASWAGKFFEELEAADSAAFFMPVGTIGKLFMHIEAQAFQMAA